MKKYGFNYEYLGHIKHLEIFKDKTIAFKTESKTFSELIQCMAKNIPPLSLFAINYFHINTFFNKNIWMVEIF